jgi:hypothetical protein
MALMALPNIIRYFRDCYEEDNRRSTLWNIFNASVTHRLFVEREERDVVYISLAVDSSTHPAALRFLDKPDVFNVSIMRARVAQRIYTSIDPAQLDSGSLLRAYLHHIDASQKETLAPRENTHRDRFLSEAEAALKGIGCETWTGYKVAGMSMDLVAARDGRSCGIDLVGYPGAYESAFPLERYRMFHRAGLRIIPLSYTLWRMRPDQCLQAIDDALSSGNGKTIDLEHEPALSDRQL